MNPRPFRCESIVPKTDSSTTRLFGTDGVRGTAGHYPLDPTTVRRLGAALVKGGEHGSPIVAGKSSESQLIRVLTGKSETEMPPEDNPKPTAEEIAVLAAWIDAGAVGPTVEEPATATLQTPLLRAYT